MYVVTDSPTTSAKQGGHYSSPPPDISRLLTCPSKMQGTNAGLITTLLTRSDTNQCTSGLAWCWSRISVLLTLPRRRFTRLYIRWPDEGRFKFPSGIWTRQVRSQHQRNRQAVVRPLCRCGRPTALRAYKHAPLVHRRTVRSSLCCRAFTQEHVRLVEIELFGK